MLLLVFFYYFYKLHVQCTLYHIFEVELFLNPLSPSNHKQILQTDLHTIISLKN